MQGGPRWQAGPLERRGQRAVPTLHKGGQKYNGKKVPPLLNKIEMATEKSFKYEPGVGTWNPLIQSFIVSCTAATVKPRGGHTLAGPPHPY